MTVVYEVHETSFSEVILRAGTGAWGRTGPTLVLFYDEAWFLLRV
jgi:hypothetical protein